MTFNEFNALVDRTAEEVTNAVLAALTAEGLMGPRHAYGAEAEHEEAKEAARNAAQGSVRGGCSS